MSDKQETIEILVIKQDEKPIRKTIPNTLEAKQHEVGGYIEPYGLKNGATIYCNEEGKLGSWSLNRAIRAYDLDDRAGSQIVEMMAGTFFISGFDPESGEDTSLTEEQFTTGTSGSTRRKSSCRTPIMSCWLFPFPSSSS